jgi:hypothetical protein
MPRALRFIAAGQLRLLSASLLLLSIGLGCSGSRKAAADDHEIQTVVLPAKTQVPGAGPYGVSTANGLRYIVAFDELNDSKVTFRVSITNNSIASIAISPTDFISLSSKDTASETPRFPVWTAQRAMDPAPEVATIDTMLAAEAGSYANYLAGQAKRDNAKVRAETRQNHEASVEGLNGLRAEWDGVLEKGMIPSGETVRGKVVFFPRREWPLVKILVPYSDTLQALIFRTSRK